MLRNSTLLLLLFLVATGYAQSPSSNCPTIVVSGPEGITQPGNLMVFSVDLSGRQILGGYTWSVSAGTIESGQGTRSIAVRTTQAEEGSNVTATVKVQGVPTGCTDTGSETAGVAARIACGLPVDDYGKVSWLYERAHLGNAQVQLEQNPGSRLFIYMRITSDESFDTTRKHARKIVKQFLLWDKSFDVSRVQVVMSVDDEHRTVYDLVPSGATPRLCESGCIEIPGSELVK